MALTAGTLLGPYEVLTPSGSGGMGDVYTRATVTHDIVLFKGLRK